MNRLGSDMPRSFDRMSKTKGNRSVVSDTAPTGDTTNASDPSPQRSPLRGSDLSDHYAEAFQEWADSGEAAVWEAVAGDGIEPDSADAAGEVIVRPEVATPGQCR